MINRLHQKYLSLFIKESEDAQKVRMQYGNFAGWNSIIFNTILFAMKLIMGLMINSLSLLADSVHSISDTATSIIVIIGFKISGKPADKKHPFGHQRAEYVATLIIAIILIVAGIEFIKEGVARFLHPSEVSFPLPILLLVTFTMLIKFWMGHLTKYIGVKIDSKAIQADAVHHYTDVISTIFVLISLILGNFGLYYFDGIGSGLVGLMLIYTGFSIAIETSSAILGTAPSKKLVFTEGLESGSMNIYPNPTNGLINIELNDSELYTIKIYDITGKKLFEKRELLPIETINISDFPNGIYIFTTQIIKDISATIVVKK